MYEIGRAGSFVSGQKWRRRLAGAWYGAVAVTLALVACGCFAGLAFLDVPPLRAAAAVVGASAVAGSAYTARHSALMVRQARRAAIGARSEREVRAAIRRTDAIAAAYGAVLGERGGDCDAVVFTRRCGAAAVEVKTGHGEVAVTNDTMRVGLRTLPGSPTRQATIQARHLSRSLDGRPVLAVVCVPGMRNRPFTTATGVWICSARDLASVLDHAPQIFDSTTEARETVERL